MRTNKAIEYGRLAARNGVRAFVLLGLLIGLGLVAGCGQKEQAQAASPNGARPPVPVVVASVQQRDVPVQFSGIGNAEAFQTVQIRSQVNGQIEGVHFKEGQDVHKGQTIGLTGQTGLAGGDHLHFTVLLDGIPVNPTEWWDPHWIHDRIQAKVVQYQQG